MATVSLPYTLVNQTKADAQEVQQNFEALKAFADGQLVQRDGSVAMAAQLQLVGDPLASDHAARKAYVDGWFPAGGIVAYVGASAPTGWAICNGASYAQATYPKTAAALGVSSGSFTVPNLVGRFPVGHWPGGSSYADQLAETGGTKDAVVVSHAHVDPDHVHYNTHGHGAGTLTAIGASAGDSRSWVKRVAAYVLGFNVQSASPGTNTQLEEAGSLPNMTVTGSTSDYTGTTGGKTAGHNVSTEGVSGTDQNLPPYTVVNFIIRMA